MPQEHYKLEKMLAALEASLPAMIATHNEPARFWAAFESKADEIEDSAARDELAMVQSRLNAMLAMHDLTPSARR